MTTRVGETFPEFYHDADEHPMGEADLAAIEARCQRDARTDDPGNGIISQRSQDALLLCAEVRRLRAEAADHRSSFDLYWRAQQRGVDAWRAAHPGKDLVSPGTDRLTEWLLEERDRLRAALELYSDAKNWKRTKYDHLRDPLDQFVYLVEDGDGDGYEVAREALDGSAPEET
jgi:hypothetical protein